MLAPTFTHSVMPNAQYNRSTVTNDGHSNETRSHMERSYRGLKEVHGKVNKLRDLQ